MVEAFFRSALPDRPTWDDRATFAERLTLALLQIPDDDRRQRMQDSVDLLAFASHDEHHLQDFTQRSGNQIASLARTDLKLCLANRNKKSVPPPAAEWQQEVDAFRAFEDDIEQDLRRQELGPPTQ